MFLHQKILGRDIQYQEFIKMKRERSTGDAVHQMRIVLKMIPFVSWMILPFCCVFQNSNQWNQERIEKEEYWKLWESIWCRNERDMVFGRLGNKRGVAGVASSSTEVLYLQARTFCNRLQGVVIDYTLSLPTGNRLQAIVIDYNADVHV